MKKITNLNYFEKEMFKYYVIKVEIIITRRVLYIDNLHNLYFKMFETRIPISLKLSRLFLCLKYCFILQVVLFFISGLIGEYRNKLFLKIKCK
jgi:hypothetical protein